MSNVNESNIYPKPKVVILFVIGVVLILFGAVYIFTRNAFISGFAISNKKGEIGDALNGLTAPITSLIGAGLVFYSFLAQLEANRLIQAQWQFDSFTKAFNDIQLEISNLKYTKDESELSYLRDKDMIGTSYDLDDTRTTYYGSEAIITFTEVYELYLTKLCIAMMNDLAFIFEELISLITEIENSQLSKHRKMTLFYRINRLYVAKLQTYQFEMEATYLKNADKINKNGDSAQPYYKSVFERMTAASQIMRNELSPTNVKATIEFTDNP